NGDEKGRAENRLRMEENGRRSVFHAGGFRKKACSGISGCKAEPKHMSRTAPGEKHAPAKIRT
ncbi:MAG: hypothetical protein IIU02_08310, partial [Treponema sp.]|uniref:hypothetical protein n=1 Tax=Treponema sp. TaxID=166 RepID=UPI0025804B34